MRGLIKWKMRQRCSLSSLLISRRAESCFLFKGGWKYFTGCFNVFIATFVYIYIYIGDAKNVVCVLGEKKEAGND